MTNNINKRIDQAIDDATQIAHTPISHHLQKLKHDEGTAAVYSVVVKECLAHHRIPAHIQERLLGDKL